MSRRNPDWAVDGADWPNREASRFVAAGGYRWHVQHMGQGPVCLLLHGTGAATHSWRDVMPALATRFTVISCDLPGHGFTHANFGQRVTLPAMAAFGEAGSMWVGGLHLIVGYATLGVLITRRPELTQAA